jgi:hypothetical protein
MRSLRVLCVLCGLLRPAFALDREAFTFTRYDLDVRVEPEQQRLAVRGKIVLRNESGQPQRNAVLQVSSTLDWRSIKAEGKAVQFVSQPYTSDIDHTGALSEAIVTLPREIKPGDSIELEIGYEGTIPQSTTRLTRIGTPEDVAKHTDWDQISPAFTGVRGVGYVAWYPVAIEAQSLEQGNEMFLALGRWKGRHAQSGMHVRISVTGDDGVTPAALIPTLPQCPMSIEQPGQAREVSADCNDSPMGLTTPAFFAGNYTALDHASLRVWHMPQDRAAATTFAQAADAVLPFLTEWFGALRDKAEVVELPDPKAAPFESDSVLLTPLGESDLKLTRLSLAHALTHAAFSSARPWISEGVAHFAQALWLEKQSGRDAALDYLGLHRTAILETEKVPGDANARSLVATTDEVLYRSKAAYVWWMVRDMVGDDALRRALRNYMPEQDREPAYFQRLLSAQTNRELEWFFDDWVYRDRGLPDFRVQSAFPRDLLNGGFVTTVTVENLGAAGAEVPITLRMQGGEVTKRLEVRGKAKATIRILTPAKPVEVVVNDGSVPESDMTNNTLKIE